MDKSGVGYDACMQYGDNHDKSIMVVRQPTMVMHPSEQSPVSWLAPMTVILSRRTANGQ